jgi:hypothetical protein
MFRPLYVPKPKYIALSRPGGDVSGVSATVPFRLSVKANANLVGAGQVTAIDIGLKFSSSNLDRGVVPKSIAPPPPSDMVHADGGMTPVMEKPADCACAANAAPENIAAKSILRIMKRHLFG